MTLDQVEEITRCWQLLEELLVEERGQFATMGLDPQVHTKDDLREEFWLHLCGLKHHSSSMQSTEKIKSRMDRDYGRKIALAIQDYNMAVCRNVTTGVLNRLPRELRDCVYSYLMPEKVTLCATKCRGCLDELHVHRHFDGWTDVSRQESDLSDAQKYAITYPCTVYDFLCPQHYWHDSVIGFDNFPELIESFYRTSRFHLRVPCVSSEREAQPENVFSYLATTDRFGRSLQPLNLISRFNLVLEVHAPIYGVQYTEHQNRAARDWVAQLFKLKKTARINVQLSLSQGAPYYRMKTLEIALVNGIMEAALPRLVDSRRAGHRVTVSLTKGRFYNLPGLEVTLEKWLAKLDEKASETGSILSS